jgi:hypothetical protein
MRKYLPFLLLASLFFLLKITNLGIWLSDSNIYFYTGYELLHGKLLYRDIFFTNFPIVPYVSAFYYLLTMGNVPLFYFTASIEVLCVGFLIYHIILRQTKDILIATLSTSLYLFSFLILATSDHQTGVFLASFFAVLSYLFYLNKRYVLIGIFLGLTLLTKAYFLPIIIAYFFLLLLKNREHFVSFFLGFLITILSLLLPFIILAPHELYRDIIAYSLTRSQGISKINIAWFFTKHDSIFLILILWNLLTFKKHLFFGLCCLFGLAFFIFYKDIYYLYLNFLVPFLCLSFPVFYSWIRMTFSPQKYFTASILLIFLLINLFIYITSYRTLQKIPEISKIVSVIQKQKPAFLYGTNDLTPLLSYLTHTPLLENIIDTNENIFRKGFLSQTTLTRKAIDEHALLIAHGASYPEFHIADDLMGGIFDRNLAQKHCKFIQSFPIQTEGVENRITLFFCK